MTYNNDGPVYSNLNGKTTNLSCYINFTYNAFEEYWESNGGTGYNPVAGV